MDEETRIKLENGVWNEEIQESMAEELSATLNNQIISRSEVEKKASQIIAADVLTASIIIGVYKDSDLSIFVLISLISLAISIYYCILVYMPKDITLGVGVDGAVNSLSEGKFSYYNSLISELSKFIDLNGEMKKTMANDLRKALWASFGAVLFFIMANIEESISLQNQLYEYVGGVIIVLLILFMARREAHQRMN